MRAWIAIVLAGCAASAQAPSDGQSAAQYQVFADVTGVAGTLVVQDNGGDDLSITSDGSYAFGTRIENGKTYDVTVKTPPAGQTCDVTSGSGTVHDGEVHVAIACSTNTYRVGGTLTGIVGDVVLQNNGADDLTLTGDGPFVFATALAYHASYAVTIATQPAMARCAVTGGSGQVPDADVTDVAVDCVPTYAIGGSVSGLSGTITIEDNGGDAVMLTADGTFAFPTRLAAGETYHVTAVGPTTQQCTVTGGDGTVGSTDVSDIAITCVDLHTVGGTVTGLHAGTTLVLKDNGADPLNVTANGGFTFATPVPQGAMYAVTIASQPSGQLCTFATAASGTVNGDVTSISLTCRSLSIALDEIYARPATGALGDTNGDGVRNSTDDEFVELINNETFAVDLAGYVIVTGTTTPAVRYTFPAGSIVGPGGRAVVFGGGTPTGSFGGALAVASGGLSLTDAPTSETVELDSAAAGGIALDTFTYDNTTFGSSCTTTCASQTRSPPGTGAFVGHAAAAGNAGILWSPGVAPTAAIPKLNPVASAPAAGGTAVSVLATPTLQFNMAMDPATFDNAHLRLYASPCAALANEVTSFTSIGAGSDPSKAVIVPATSLAYATDYCLTLDTTVASAINVVLAAADSLQFTTRDAASAPAANVVISEVGGCRLSGTTGTTACGDTGANDELVELYNPTAAAIDISGWFVQRRSAGGSASCAATIPAATTIAAGGFYLIGGAGYTAAHYPGSPAADLIAGGSLVVGGTSESVVLITSAGTCTGSSNVVDAVSIGTITDSLAALELPAIPTTGITDGTSIERKACYDSTADASAMTGMLVGGGHEAQGNSEHLGANNADWIVRSTPNPQSSTATPETRTCM